MSLRAELVKKLKALRAIDVGDSYTKSSEISKILTELDSLSTIKVHHKEITFYSDHDRTEYCELFSESKDDYSLSSDMLKEDLDNPNGTLFLLSNRPPRGNKFVMEYQLAKRKEDKNKIKELNKKHQLSWHTTALYYQNGVAYYFDSSINVSNHYLPQHSRTIRAFPYRSKIINFMEFLGEKVEKILITGKANNINGLCRPLALMFIKDVIEAKLKGQPCKYQCVQVGKGYHEPRRKYLAYTKVIPAKFESEEDESISDCNTNETLSKFKSLKI